MILNGCIPSLDKYIQPEIDRISAKWVPDLREGLCNVTAIRGEGGLVIIRGETTIPQAKIEIIKTLNKKGITLIDSIITLPDTAKNDKYTGLVTLSVINLRKLPDHASELVSQAILGTPVMILKEEGSWLLIQTPDKYISWTEKSSVKLLTRSEISAWKKSERVIYMENTGWIYSSPDESGVIGDIVAGSILQKEGESKGYAKVILPDGRKGFVDSNKLEDFQIWKTRVQCTDENICRVASTFLGLPYLWGGSSTKAVDCSGFVQSVYFRNGIILSRDASLQALHGFAVDISGGTGQLKKGDLLFFGTRRNATPHVTHTAIYLGNSEYINSSGRVMINSFDSTRANFGSSRKKSLLAARRILDFEDDKGIVPVSKHEWY